MPTSFAAVEAEALALSPEERVSLADHLLASVANHRGVDEAWGAEVERRLVEVESGRMPLYPLEEVIRRARKALS